MKFYKKKIRVKVDNIPVQLAAAEIGTGRPVCFIHGWGHSLERWFPVMYRLRRTCRSLAIDLPGFGDSPPLAAGNINLEYYGKIIQAYIDSVTVGNPYSLVAHSLGGLAVLTNITRGGATPARLVLLSIPAYGYTGIPGLAKYPRFMTAFFKSRKIIPARLCNQVIRKTAIYTVYHKNSIDKLMFSDVMKMDSTTAARFLGEIARLKSGKIVPPPGNQPVVLIRGVADRIVGARQSRQLAACLQASYLEIPAAGHTIMTDNPGELLSLFMYILAGKKIQKQEKN